MHTSLGSIVNLVLIGQLTSYLLNFCPKLTLGKYDAAVLQRAISILGIILLAAGWVMEVLSYAEIIYSENHWECFRLALLCRWSSYKGG